MLTHDQSFALFGRWNGWQRRALKGPTVNWQNESFKYLRIIVHLKVYGYYDEKHLKSKNWKGQYQCDQMVRLFLITWLFATLQISPIMSQICQSRPSIMSDEKKTDKNLPKTCKLSPKRRNFAKSGHIG